MDEHPLPTDDAGPLARLRMALEKGKLKRVRRILRVVHPAGAAHLLESLTPEERAGVRQVIDSKLEEPVLEHLSPVVPSTLAKESDVDTDAVVVAGKTQLERLLTAVERGRPKRIVKSLSGTHPAKIAGLLESLPLAERRTVWDLLDIKRAARVLGHLHSEARTRLALAGFTIPLIMRRLGIDPALAGGVVLTTVTDVVGFFAYLGLATVFLL